MTVVVFSNYFATGNEADSFDVGHAPILDGIDGFFDQSFEMSKPGDRLFFLVTDSHLWEASRLVVRRPAPFRDTLNQAPMITGIVTETDRCSYARCCVERRETFLEVYERKPTATSNEAVEEIGRYDVIWAGIRANVERMGEAYHYILSCQLPPMSAVVGSLRGGLVGLRPDRQTTLLVEPLAEKQGVRVIALGRNDIDSSRIFDIPDTEEYRAALRAHLAGARLPDETKFWDTLLA